MNFIYIYLLLNVGLTKVWLKNFGQILTNGDFSNYCFFILMENSESCIRIYKTLIENKI